MKDHPPVVGAEATGVRGGWRAIPGAVGGGAELHGDGATAEAAKCTLPDFGGGRGGIVPPVHHQRRELPVGGILRAGGGVFPSNCNIGRVHADTLPAVTLT